MCSATYRRDNLLLVQKRQHLLHETPLVIGQILVSLLAALLRPVFALKRHLALREKKGEESGSVSQLRTRRQRERVSP